MSMNEMPFRMCNNDIRHHHHRIRQLRSFILISKTRRSLNVRSCYFSCLYNHAIFNTIIWYTESEIYIWHIRIIVTNWKIDLLILISTHIYFRVFLWNPTSHFLRTHCAILEYAFLFRVCLKCLNLPCHINSTVCCIGKLKL